LYRIVSNGNTGYNPEKLSWVHVPVRADSVARKISAIEEWSQCQVVCFGDEITRIEATIPKKSVLGSRSDDVVSLAWKLKRQKNGAKTKVVCFVEKITEAKATRKKICPGFKSL
jgi:hypothetical protein